MFYTSYLGNKEKTPRISCLYPEMSGKVLCYEDHKHCIKDVHNNNHLFTKSKNFLQTNMKIVSFYKFQVFMR